MSDDLIANRFRLAPLIGIVVLALVGIGAFANWYGGAVALPRYCENPDETIVHLERVLMERQPAGEENRRPYLIAAKLLFLVPRESGETVPNYLHRVRRHLASGC